MESNNFLETVAERLGQNGSVKNVYGEPITAHGKIIIPVAQIAMGMGGGHGKKNGKSKENALDENQQGGIQGEGSGGGGGMYASAKGVYEVTDRHTRFIPANATRKLLAISTIAFILGRWIGARKMKKSLYKSLKK